MTRPVTKLSTRWRGELEVKPAHKIELEEPQLNLVQPQGQAEFVVEAEEKLTHINSSYTLNDYFLPRGFANLYVSGVGTKDSTGFMTNGDYQQIEAYKNVIDWLNGPLPCLYRPYAPASSQG